MRAAMIVSTTDSKPLAPLHDDAAHFCFFLRQTEIAEVKTWPDITSRLGAPPRGALPATPPPGRHGIKRGHSLAGGNSNQRSPILMSLFQPRHRAEFRIGLELQATLVMRRFKLVLPGRNVEYLNRLLVKIPLNMYF